MSLQPDFPRNPFSLVTGKNQHFAKHLQDHGADAAKVDEILQAFYSFKVVVREIEKNARNPEWERARVWIKTVGKKYESAIKSLERLLSDDTIPSGWPLDTKGIIKKDVEKLKERKRFLTFAAMKEPLTKPKPVSVHQMIGFQALALYKYLGKFKGTSKDEDVYDLMAELFRNLYKNIACEEWLRTLTGALLKSNYIDNADKLRGKYKELEKAVKPFL